MDVSAGQCCLPTFFQISSFVTYWKKKVRQVKYDKKTFLVQYLFKMNVKTIEVLCLWFAGAAVVCGKASGEVGHAPVPYLSYLLWFHSGWNTLLPSFILIMRSHPQSSSCNDPPPRLLKEKRKGLAEAAAVHLGVASPHNGAARWLNWHWKWKCCVNKRRFSHLAPV